MKNFIAQVLLVVVLMGWLWVVTKIRVVTFEDDSLGLQVSGEVVTGVCPDWFVRLNCTD